MLVTVIFLIVVGFLSACQGLIPTPIIYPTDTPTVTVTPTITIQWFPSTATPTPNLQPVRREPTPNQRLAVGAVVVSDSFTDASLWQTYDTYAGTAQVARGVLSMAAPDSPANLLSLRRGAVPQDFYLEITTSVNLCRGKDTYGVLFRADGSASQYRLIVSCDGLLRVERWRPSEASAVQDWTPSGQIANGGPQTLRLGIWMVGGDLRIFVNDVFQFAVRDPLLTGSQVGVFLRSTGANATTVSFSDLKVSAIQGYVPSPIPSATPVVTIYPTRAPTLTTTPVK